MIHKPWGSIRTVLSGPLERTWKLLRSVVHLTYAVLLLLVLAIVSEAAFPTSIQLTVSAVVLKKAWVQATPPPATLEITPQDIARGYIDAPHVTAVSLRNNSDDGFVFHFQINPEVVSSVSVSGLHQPLVVGPTGAVAPLPGHFRTEQRMDLRWRMQLSPQVTAGVQPWPVRMDISAN